jgi:hypothetical protein
MPVAIDLTVEKAPPQLAARATSSRLLNLDLLRGYFVMMLAAIHLDYVPSLFGSFDGRGSLWVSEADGFFLISGMLVAMLRRRDLERGGMMLATRRSWRRAGQLYVLACGLTLLYTALARFGLRSGWTGIMPGVDAHSSWPELMVRTLTGRYIYGWANFLMMYVPMFLLAPLLVWALRRRLDALVLIVSLAAYASLTWHGEGAAQGYLQWQADFVLGAVIGFHFKSIGSRLGAVAHAVRTRLAWIAMTAAALLYAAGMVMLYHPSWHDGSRLYDDLLADNRLGLIRPLLCVVMFAGGYAALTMLRRPVMATVGPLLELFGKNSLYVYVAQSLFVFVVPLVLPRQSGIGGFFVNSAVDLAIVGIVWLGLRTEFLTRYVPR